MDIIHDGQMGVLGSLLIDPKAVAGEIFHRVCPDDFRDEKYRAVFSAAREIFLENGVLDPVAIADRAGEQYAPFMAEVMRLTPTAANFEVYIEILLKQSKLRKANCLALELAGAKDMDAVAPALEKLNALMVGKRGRQAVSLQDALQDFFDRHSGPAPNYLRWGMPFLDERIRCEAGDFVVIGGYPSAGKTMLTVQFALELAKKYRVGYFSLETKSTKVTDRLMSHKAQVPLLRIKDNMMSQDDWKRCTDAAEAIHHLTLETVPASGMTAADVQAYALSKRYEVVIVDYLQLLRGSSRGERYNVVTEASMALHTMAQSYGMTVIATSQLTRPEKGQKQPKPPSIQDLRESGQIEQDADIIMLLYQENPNEKNSPRVLKIGKNKEGETGRTLLEFRGEVQTLLPMPPSKAESYAAVRKAAAAAKRERQQMTMQELQPGEGGELPF